MSILIRTVTHHFASCLKAAPFFHSTVMTIENFKFKPRSIFLNLQGLLSAHFRFKNPKKQFSVSHNLESELNEITDNYMEFRSRSAITWCLYTDSITCALNIYVSA